MLNGNDNKLSLTKVITLIAFLSFIGVSIYVLYAIPEKFSYELFSLLTGIGSFGTRVADKITNVISANKFNGGKE